MPYRIGTLIADIFLVAATLSGQCLAPSAPTVQSAPAAQIAIGQTYAIGWSSTSNDDSYILERSTSPLFAKDLEQQQVTTNAGSFITAKEGIYYHRVRAVAGCDPKKQSANSAATAVTVVGGPPVVVISVQPLAAIVDVGATLDGVASSMEIENIGRSDVAVSLATEAIGSPPFFFVSDPSGGDVGHLLLAPRVPKQLSVRFSGVATSAAASYQGLISVRGFGTPLSVTPYAFVNLKIGSSGNAVPAFRVAGLDANFVSIPGYSPNDPDSARPPLRVEIFNPGTSPLDVAGEIAPEAWLLPKAGWNSASIPPKSSITVELTVDRSRAIVRSAFPRYTYFTVRTKSGASARLTVQDNDVVSPGSFSLPPIASTERSFLLARVALAPGPLGTYRTRLRLSNVSNIAVRTDLYFLPVTIGAATHVSIVVPSNDVVSVSDALTQLFAISAGNNFGQIEIRTASENASFLTVNAETYAGTTTLFHIPVILRGEGARPGQPHAISGVSQNAAYRSIVTLVETTRLFPCMVTISAFDSAGTLASQAQIPLAAAGEFDLSLAGLFPGTTTLTNGRVEIAVNNTGVTGAVTAILTLVENATASISSVYTSQPVITPQFPKAAAAVLPSIQYSAVGAINGTVGGRNYTTLLGISAPQGGADLLLSYFGSNYSPTVAARLTLGSGQSLEIANVLKDVFRIPEGSASQGTISITTAVPVTLFGRLLDMVSGSQHVAGNLPVISSQSEAIVSASAGFQRPTYFDGLEQSIDPTRGSRWSLSLSEINGASATVLVRLYEPGNRTSPIAEREFDVNPREHKVLDTVFAEMGLDTDERRKERTNVMVVVIPTRGFGAVAAVASGFNVTSGDVVRFLLTPNGGVPATGASKVTAVPLPPPPPRRRVVGR